MKKIGEAVTYILELFGVYFIFEEIYKIEFSKWSGIELALAWLVAIIIILIVTLMREIGNE